MSSGKKKKKSNRVVVVPEGLQIEDDDKFYRDVRNALAVSLDAGFLSQDTKQIGSRQLVYIRQPSSPTVRGREGSLPALPIFTDDRQSAWLVVELESEYGQPLMLKHVSLKLWQGTTTDAAHLCFRAEWDVRDAKLSHAQPHWNVHAPRGMTAAPLATEVDFRAYSTLEQAAEVNSFAEFVQAQEPTESDPPHVAATDYGLSVEQLHKFHFAMSSNWHVPNGSSGPTISTTEEVVTWIGSCASYIRRQFAFVMGV